MAYSSFVHDSRKYSPHQVVHVYGTKMLMAMNLCADLVQEGVFHSLYQNWKQI